MHGGLKVYRGSPAAARSYVEADRGRADDYYLGQGTGLADRYVASPGVGERPGVRREGTMTGDAYEAWVGGYDPDTGAPKGRVRADAQAVRFVEVVVNGPKSWSLAAVLDPEIAAAYDGAQDRAAEQIIGWLAEHATTRVGPRGRQVQVPVQEIQAAVVRHYTSRAGDPHRHLHLQVNARVFAEGTWRGLHTVGVRDALDAINGIGHAAVMTDPGFRAALATHGYTLDHESGEVAELVDYVGPFSARAGQIARNIDRYEAQWRAANPGAEPGPKLRRAWDARAWADARPDKVIPADGTQLAARWVEELTELGFRPDLQVARPAAVDPVGPLGAGRAVVRPGALDRNAAVEQVLARQGARRSGWNAADVRGEVEQLIARTGLVAHAAVRLELAEDLTARALDACVPLLTHRDGSPWRGVPEHVRALTSPAVLEVEADITTAMIARAQESPVRAHLEPAAGLDVAQREVVAALAGTGTLLVVEGAAGAGKTTTLAAARTALGQQGHRLVVVTPTLKAATVARRELGSRAFSAAWLAHQYGYRWDDHGVWTRLAPGQRERHRDPQTAKAYAGPAPAAALAAGDLLLVDEAGMLDQDTARALLTIADQSGARVALVGDRHQLPAVGRGGVLDLAARWAPLQACLTLDVVHRFSDPQYARISLAMRTGEPLGTGGKPTSERRGAATGAASSGVFDALLARDQIRIYPTQAERTQALAVLAAASIIGGEHEVLVMAETREQVASLNGAIRDRLVAAGRVQDTGAITTQAGERIGVGDRVATRRNDRALQVANRDTWTLTAVSDDGTATLTGSTGQQAVLPPSYVRRHVELAYASTSYGAQGETISVGHLLLGEHTGAAGAYVGMTRGRDTNIAHLVAPSIEDARAQWVGAFSRDRADLGPAHAARLAAGEADKYAPQRPQAQVLAEVYRAWTTEADLSERLAATDHLRDQLAQVVSIRAGSDTQLARLDKAAENAWAVADHARTRADQAAASIKADGGRIAEVLRGRWDNDYPAASAAAETIRGGSGRFGRHRGDVRQARAHLQEWAQTWRPVLPQLPAGADELAAAMPYTATSALHQTITSHAQHTAEQAHPDHRQLAATAQSATAAAHESNQVRSTAAGSVSRLLDRFGSLAYTDDPTGRLAETEHAAAELTVDLNRARERVGALRQEPAIRTLTPGRLQTERENWQAKRAEAQEETDSHGEWLAATAATTTTRVHPEDRVSATPDRGRGQGIGR
jgi:conjugative relaxase-like TrwC/TraI family protein